MLCPSLHREVALLLQVRGFADQVGQAGGCNGDRDADDADEQGNQQDAGMIHAAEEEDGISQEEEQDISGDEPGNALQELRVFLREGTVRTDVAGDLPAQNEDDVAGNGGAPEENHPGPVPGREFRIGLVHEGAEIWQDPEVDNCATDSDSDDNGLQPEGKLFLIHGEYLPIAWVCFRGYHTADLCACQQNFIETQ